jgi:hypothetical protein
MTRALLAVVALAGCYNPPEPDCAFVCGAGDACPADYTCAADHQCHRNGTPDSLMCSVLSDAAGPSGPHVLSIAPLNAATGVSLDVTPTFTVDQDLLGVSVQTFTLTQGGSTPISGTVDYATGSLQAHFVPDSLLAEFTFYQVGITPGITNIAGQPLAPLSWTFITGADTVPPHVSATMPVDTQTDIPVSTNIQVFFSEAVTGVDATNFTAAAGGPIAGSVSESDQAYYIFAPAALLPAHTTVTVTLGSGIQDLKGNAFGGYTFSFTTQ